MTVVAPTFSPWSLGASLYMPALRRDLMDCANGEKLPQVRSMIFCTEDAIAAADVEQSVRHLGLCLQGFKDLPQRYRFIRARNPDVLARLLDLPHIEKIDGFVLPKFDSTNVSAYLDQLHGTHFKIMPTLETKAVFDASAMVELRDTLLQHSVCQQILLLRIGGNDLMHLLGLRRSKQFTLYDTPIGHVIAQLVTIFKPYGFALSAPVFDYLAETATLQREVELDLAYGLIGKTAIHPSQIPVIEAAYQVSYADYEMASKLVEESAPAVFKLHNTLCEVATHGYWAMEIIRRQQCYGLQDAVSNDYIERSYR